MGQFVNPGCDLFRDQINSKIYVDKTGLISLTNSSINTSDRFICNSRPRRFGKSYAADMLTAYYSRGAEAKALFDGLEISCDDSYETYLNKLDVIRFDVQWCVSDAGSAEKVVDYINKKIVSEMKDEYSDVDFTGVSSAFGAMNEANVQTGRRFVVIIDEWDSIIRDTSNDQRIVDNYIDFLCGMFKGTNPLNYIALAYITGILPIKRQQTQSALNNFKEFTMLQPRSFAKYIGFTDQEVRSLCDTYGCDYNEIRRWYDGYILGDYQIYNPNAVADAAKYGDIGNSWVETGSFDAVRPYINMDFDGLKQSLIDMTAGNRVHVNTNTFENHTDRSAFNNRDDVFTYMIHLGYLAFDQKRQEAFVPNEEIRQVLGAELSDSKWSEFDSFRLASEKILESTLEGDGESVAADIGKIHDRYASSIWYNNENSLAGTINIAYLSTLKYYFKPVREMPTGRGFADIVYLPMPEYLHDVPALVIELKWDHDAETALDQIRNRHYTETLEDYTGDILLIGISYNKKDKLHKCRIERIIKN